MPLSARLRSVSPATVPAFTIFFVVVLVAFASFRHPLAVYAAAQAQAAPAKLGGHTCLTVADAGRQPNKDICVSAHVYAVVESADGTRFLDVCPADVPDDLCQFTLLSLREDRDEVGDLRKYRDQDVNVRGVVRATHGRMGMQISHIRQFRGGPEKFRPNPALLRNFNGQSDRMPVRDPNLAGSGRHRSFMNNSDKEELPTTPKH
jgi:hypothetical protein